MTVLIILPTYNERENLPLIVSRLRRQLGEADILVVDDNSPDGTGALADALSEQDPCVNVLHRGEKDGLGRAYVAGFTWGLEQGYDRLVQMDADLSHDPEYVPALLAATETYDLALGSRYVDGGGTVSWGWGRRVLSRGGSLYARTILGLPTRDLTSGFKVWRRHTLLDIDLPSVRSNGYSFQIEMTYRAILRGHRVVEVPIIFTDRVDGQSKMSKKIVLEAIGMVWKLRANARTILGAPAAGRAAATTAAGRGETGAL